MLVITVVAAAATSTAPSARVTSSSVRENPAAVLRRRGASWRAVARGRLGVIEPGSESAVKTFFRAVQGIGELRIVCSADRQEAQERFHAQATGEGATPSADLHR